MKRVTMGHTGAQGFVLDAHVPVFERVSEIFDAYILVRKTGHASLKWVGKRGYIAKRGDLKCKTADTDVGNYSLAGLVCSPIIHPQAFQKKGRLDDAIKNWGVSQHLITRCAFTGDDWPKIAATPYLLQSDSKNRHYGTLAWIEYGIVSPKYVHGDYDLYAVVPAKSIATRAAKPINYNQVGVPSSLPLTKQTQLNDSLLMNTGPLLFEIMNHLDRAFGYPMVMHAEQENLSHIQDDVMVFLPPVARRGGRGRAMTLHGRTSIEYFYRTEFRGRSAGPLAT